MKLIATIVLLAAVSVMAADDGASKTPAQAAIERADRAVKQADDAWRKSVIAAKLRLVEDLRKLRDAAARKQSDVSELDSILLRTEQEIQIIKGSTSLVSAITLDRILDPVVEMYDVMKPESDKFRPGDEGGYSFRESTLRPKDPMGAFRKLAKGMTKKEVLQLLGGYQESSERDNTLVISWIFGGGMNSTVNVTFVDGKVTSFSRIAR